MKVISETKELRLEHEYESTYLRKITDNEILLVEDFYGDPTCGLIDTKNQWAIVAGTHLLLWKPTGVIRFRSEKFKDIHTLRSKNENTIEVLVDPWSEISAIWELDIRLEKIHKVMDFKKHQRREYTEEIEW